MHSIGVGVHSVGMPGVGVHSGPGHARGMYCAGIHRIGVLGMEVRGVCI
jgi:hypothetical protein